MRRPPAGVARGPEPEGQRMSNLWQCLEALGEVGAVAAEWKHRTEGDFETFKEAFLQEANRTAPSYPCPHGCGCAHKVHKKGDGRFVGVCKCGEDVACGDLALTAE